MYLIQYLVAVATASENKNHTILRNKEIESTVSNLEANIAVALREAYNGEYTVDDDGRPEPAPEMDTVTWDELDVAYQTGYDEGYTEGVNSAYDQ